MSSSRSKLIIHERVHGLTDAYLLKYGMGLSHREGGVEDKLLHWEFGPVMSMTFQETAKNYLFSSGPVPFHWDGAFHREPSLLLFYCTESEGEGGETLFADTEKLWSSLSEAQKSECMKVRLTYKTEKLAHYGGEITVPLVRSHPRTGAPILRIAEEVKTELNPVSLKIEGTGDPEGLYRELVARLYSPEITYEHRWKKGDLVLCDNFTFLHGRKALGLNLKRSFKRIQVL